MFDSENPFVRQFLGGAADGPLGMERRPTVPERSAVC
jgi:hypothetical protein